MRPHLGLLLLYATSFLTLGKNCILELLKLLLQLLVLGLQVFSLCISCMQEIP